jgi:hypothetical protein
VRKPNSEICLTTRELKRGFAYRSRARCERYYRVGDVRKAKGRDNCSHGAKIEIVRVGYCRSARKTKITFRKVKEHKEVVYINMTKEGNYAVHKRSY